MQTFQSSDDIRHAKPLKYARSVTFDEPFQLEREGVLPELTIVYETYGELNPARDNGVLIFHALSGDSHVARHDDADDPGWWDIMVGPGRPIDTDHYQVICANILGGCRGTTGPNSINPATGKPYAADFPVISVGDIVRTQRMLLDHLGIDQLLAVVGGSLGGFMLLDFVTRFPERAAGAVAIGTSARLTSQALAFDIVGRNAILRDPHYHGGEYYDKGTGPRVGLALARMLGHITYLSREAMMQKFDADRLRPRDIQSQFETKFSVGSYLAYQADRFGRRFDANSYLTLTMALDLFDLGRTPEQLVATLDRSTCRWLLMGFTTDWLFPEFQLRELADALISRGKRVSCCNIASECGHDAFLLPDEIDSYGGMTAGFLANLREANGRRCPACGGQYESFSGKSCPARSDTKSPLPPGEGSTGETQVTPVDPGDPSLPIDGEGHAPTSIFHRRNRLDYDTIVELIPPGASVLDLGCGTGGLLVRLRRQGQGRGGGRLMGIELDERAIRASIHRGLDVVQADLNRGLPAFANGQFDYVVLSQTLQSVMDVERIIGEMLRVGRRAIVSFPNLGYEKFRRQLAEEGRAPQVGVEEGHRWYNTPNVRWLTLADFEQFCDEQALTIEQCVALDTAAGIHIEVDPYTQADVAIAVLSR